MVARLDDKDPWFFLKPLSVDLWIMSAGFFILTGFIVWLIEHPINAEFQGSVAWQIGTIFWFAASTLVYAHSKLCQFCFSHVFSYLKHTDGVGDSIILTHIINTLSLHPFRNRHIMLVILVNVETEILD